LGNGQLASLSQAAHNNVLSGIRLVVGHYVSGIENREAHHDHHDSDDDQRFHQAEPVLLLSGTSHRQLPFDRKNRVRIKARAQSGRFVGALDLP
jgi:hypothetical protein